MSAVAERRALAAIGCDLIARDGGPGARRGAALLRRLARAEPAAVDLDALAEVPAWLRLPQAAQEKVAHRAALLSIAPALAGTIDGATLGAHAQVAGEAAVDWAIGRAERIAHGLPTVPAEGLSARGFALMRAALPERLRPLLGGAGERADYPRTLAAGWVDEAVKGASAA